MCGFFGLAAGCALRDDGLYILPVMDMVNYDACGSVTGFILKSDCQDRSEYMYLWKVDALVADLKTGAVTQRDECLYMLLFMLLIWGHLFNPARLCASVAVVQGKAANAAK
jgi:hypothetical protein